MRTISIAFLSILVWAGITCADESVVSEDAIVRAAAAYERSTVMLWIDRGAAASAVLDTPQILWTALGRDRVLADKFTRSGGQEARGCFVGDGTVILTAASAVRGASRIQVHLEGKWQEATMIGADADFEVALLRSPVKGTPLEVDATSDLEPGRLVVLPAEDDADGIDAVVVSSRVTHGDRRGRARISRVPAEDSVGAPAIGPDGRIRGLVLDTIDPTTALTTLFQPSPLTVEVFPTPRSAAQAEPQAEQDRTQSEAKIRYRLATQARGEFIKYAGKNFNLAQVGARMQRSTYLVEGRRIARALEDLLAEGRVRKAYLGVVLGGEAPNAGRVVLQTLPDSPAKGAFQASDVILAVGGRRLEPHHEVAQEILALKSGSPAVVLVRRDGREVEVSVTPAERTGDAFARGPAAFGFAVLPLTAELKTWLGTEESGVIVSAVVTGGAAHRAGFHKGDRLAKLAGRTIATADDVDQAADDALRRLAAGEPVEAEVVRGAQRLTLRLLGR